MNKLCSKFNYIILNNFILCPWKFDSFDIFNINFMYFTSLKAGCIDLVLTFLVSVKLDIKSLSRVHTKFFLLEKPKKSKALICTTINRNKSNSNSNLEI